MFSSYGGPPKVKCKRHTSQKGISWTKRIGRCETCKDLNLSNVDTEIFEVRKKIQFEID